MSPNINSFVGDLVEMARAMEELPAVKAALETEKATCELYANKVTERELHIIELKAQIDQQHETIRNLEVARDDAELRFLEADERASHVLAMVRASMVGLDKAQVMLDPPKPQPEPEVPVQPVDPKPEPAPSEFVGVQDNPTPVAMSGDPIDVDSWASGPGQSDTTPMEPSSMIDGEENTGQVSTPSEPSKGRYSGRRYYDWATYVPLHQWLAEGGTEEDYNWRPVSSRIG